MVDGNTEVADGQTGRLMRVGAGQAITDNVSHLSKAWMWERFKALSDALSSVQGDTSLHRAASGSYGDAKHSAQGYQNAKAAARAHFQDRTGGEDGQRWFLRSEAVPGLEEF